MHASTTEGLYKADRFLVFARLSGVGLKILAVLIARQAKREAACSASIRKYIEEAGFPFVALLH